MTSRPIEAKREIDAVANAILGTIVARASSENGSAVYLPKQIRLMEAWPQVAALRYIVNRNMERLRHG